MHGRPLKPLRLTAICLLLLLLATGCGRGEVRETPTAEPSETAQPAAAVFENVRVFDGTSTGLSEPVNVLVVDNIIKEISAGPIQSPPGLSTTRISGGGRTLMPGMIDAHVHLYLNADMKVLLDPETKADTLEKIALGNAEATLKSGFTTVRDMAGPVFSIKKTIDAGDAVGPRIYPSGTIISQTAGHGDFSDPAELPRSLGGPVTVAEQRRFSSIADGRDQVLTAVRYNLRNGASQIKIAASGGIASTFDPLDVHEYTADEIQAAVQAASDFGTYVSAHAYNPISVRRCVDAGVKVIEHGQLMDEETVRYLRDKDVWLSTQTFEELPESFSQLQREKNHDVVLNQDKVWRWALQYGVKLAWGTDFLFGSPQYGVAANQSLASLTKWLTPARALKLVTHDNAELLALSGPRNPYPGKLGVVTEGAYADLLLVDGDPTRDLNVIADPDKNFRVIMRDGRIYKNTL